METNRGIISFSTISEEGHLFENIYLFKDELLNYLKICGVILKDPNSMNIIVSPNNDNSSYYLLTPIEIIGNDYERKLAMAFNKKGYVMFATFYRKFNTNYWIRKEISNDFMTMKEFSKYFPVIVEDLK